MWAKHDMRFGILCQEQPAVLSSIALAYIYVLCMYMQQFYCNIYNILCKYAHTHTHTHTPTHTHTHTYVYTYIYTYTYIYIYTYYTYVSVGYIVHDLTKLTQTFHIIHAQIHNRAVCMI